MTDDDRFDRFVSRLHAEGLKEAFLQEIDEAVAPLHAAIAAHDETLMSKETNALEEKLAVEARKSLLLVLEYGDFGQKLEAAAMYFNAFGGTKPKDVARPLTFGQKG